MEECWHADDLPKINAIPWSMHERPETEVRLPAEDNGAARQASQQQMGISKADLDKYGYTVGCSQCRRFEEYVIPKQS